MDPVDSEEVQADITEAALEECTRCGVSTKRKLLAVIRDANGKAGHIACPSCQEYYRRMNAGLTRARTVTSTTALAAGQVQAILDYVRPGTNAAQRALPNAPPVRVRPGSFTGNISLNPASYITPHLHAGAALTSMPPPLYSGAHDLARNLPAMGYTDAHTQYESAFEEMCKHQFNLSDPVNIKFYYAYPNLKKGKYDTTEVWEVNPAVPARIGYDDLVKLDLHLRLPNSTPLIKYTPDRDCIYQLFMVRNGNKAPVFKAGQKVIYLCMDAKKYSDICDHIAGVLTVNHTGPHSLPSSAKEELFQPHMARKGVPKMKSTGIVWENGIPMIGTKQPLEDSDDDGPSFPKTSDLFSASNQVHNPEPMGTSEVSTHNWKPSTTGTSSSRPGLSSNAHGSAKHQIADGLGTLILGVNLTEAIRQQAAAGHQTLQRQVETNTYICSVQVLAVRTLQEIQQDPSLVWTTTLPIPATIEVNLNKMVVKGGLQGAFKTCHVAHVAPQVPVENPRAFPWNMKLATKRPYALPINNNNHTSTAASTESSQPSRVVHKKITSFPRFDAAQELCKGNPRSQADVTQS
ncbi:hypothetical protein M422DRAFT_264390 [Sphaerobolus stellatus SS14]|uniref:Uncharacterized protein n=1 Tax=Sphaerobolus stellatus (strain SS14) TaxID=990650 RepID=A0A0C9UFQ0_SPHS4|nr:hypothetical protein M422DRAFT_264390 [Sphaerobolus stellatus SS14]